MKNEAIMDFEDSCLTDEMKDKLIDAIKNDKKLFPISVDFDGELDLATIRLELQDDKGIGQPFATINMSYMAFHSLVEENGFKAELGEEVPTKEQEKEMIESLKDNPFKDMLKEVSK